MPDVQITNLPNWAGAQVSTDLLTGVDLSQAVANQNVKTTLNDLFEYLASKNITDEAMKWTTAAAPPAVSAATEAALYFDGTQFLVSYNGAAYAPLGALPAGSGSELQYRASASAFGAVTGSSVSGADVIIDGSVQLGTVSTTTGALALAHASSAFLTTITAGNAAAARTYTWPVDFGAAGSVLTDAAGNGTLSWANAGLSNPYSQNSGSSAAIYFEYSQNTPATGRWGVENGTGGGTIFTGSATNAIVFGSVTTSPVEFYYNDSKKLELVAGGISVSSDVAATTFNGNTLTTGTFTLTGAAAKVLTFNNTLTFSGTDSAAVSFGAGGTVLYTGGLLWDAIGNPAGNQALTMAANTSTWTWSATSGTGNLFTLTNGSNDTGTNYLFAVSTIGATNAKKPIQVVAQTSSVVIDSDASGRVGLGGAVGSSRVQLGGTSASTSVAVVAISGPLNMTAGLISSIHNINDTATVDTHATFATNSNGTAATGFGARFVFQLESSTTNQQDAAYLNWLWTDATHATRTSGLDFYTVYQAAAASRALRIAGDRSLNLANAAASPAAAADSVSFWSADSAAGDANLFTVNEAGEVNRLTGLACRVSTQFDKTTDDTLANVTGLSRNVDAARSYAFRAELYTTSDVAGGVKVAISGTATATSIVYDVAFQDASVLTLGARATALDTPVGLTTITVAHVTITGTIVVNAAGTLTVQMAQNASNGAASSVLVNSTFQLFPIA
jgi:hypothetical protein